MVDKGLPALFIDESFLLVFTCNIFLAKKDFETSLCYMKIWMELLEYFFYRIAVAVLYYVIVALGSNVRLEIVP